MFLGRIQTIKVEIKSEITAEMVIMLIINRKTIQVMEIEALQRRLPDIVQLLQ